MRFHCAGTFGDDECFDLVVRKSDDKEYKSDFAYIRNGVSHTNSYVANPTHHETNQRGHNKHPMNHYDQDGVWGQINMFADASGAGFSENEFEFRLEETKRPGTLIPLDDEKMLVKMAFIDFDEDRRRSVQETFCVNVDQLDLANPKHASGDDRFFLPGLGFGGQDGQDLDVKIANTDCDGKAGKKSIKVTSKRVGFLCDNPEHASLDDFYSTLIRGKGDPKARKNVVFCKDCFSSRNPSGRCHGPTVWEERNSGYTEKLNSAGKEWQYYPERPDPREYGQCESCEPQCISVSKCKQKFSHNYNNPYMEPWKRSVQLSFKKPSFKVKYGVKCTNRGKRGKPYQNPKDETCDRNFQFGVTYWAKICRHPNSAAVSKPSPTTMRKFPISPECKERDIGAKSCRKCTQAEIDGVVADLTQSCANTLRSEFKKDRSTSSQSAVTQSPKAKPTPCADKKEGTRVDTQTQWDLKSMASVCPCLGAVDINKLNYCNPIKGFPPLKALYKDCLQYEWDQL